MRLTIPGITVGVPLALAACLSSPSATGPAARAQEQQRSEVSSPTPASVASPRLGASNVVYLGSFRLPVGLAGSANGFQYAAFGQANGGGGGIAYYPAGNGGAGSLYVGGSGLDFKGASVAELAIPGTGSEPALVQGNNLSGGSTNLTSLPTTRFIQNFHDISGGLASSDPGGALVAELLVYNNHLYAAARIAFDAEHLARVSHLRHGLDLSVSDTFGWETVADSNLWNGWSGVKGDPSRAVGMITGPMGDVPSALQSSLGGPVVAGVWGTSIIGRSSYGPAAFTFDPDRIGRDTPSRSSLAPSSSRVPATGLFYYPTEHQTLGPWAQGAYNNAYFSWSDYPAGLIIEDNCLIIPMVSGRGHATSDLTGRDTVTYYYGPATHDWAENGVATADGIYAYNPQVSAHSGHAPMAWPYFYRFIGYDVADLQAVKAGTKKPWEIIPYGKWDLPVPFSMGGSPYVPGSLHATYDRPHRILYILQAGSVDQFGTYFPLVHVYRLTAAS